MNTKTFSPFFLVWNPKTGQTRIKHQIYNTARMEAERLAAIEPHSEFYVLEAKAKCRINNVEWEEVSEIPF